MSSCYKLRADLSVPSLDAILSVFSDSSSYAYVVEGSSTPNPHVHAYLKTLVKSPALRARLRKIGLKGNGGYSLVSIEENPVEYLAYLMKEGKVTWYNVPQEIIDQSVQYDLSVKKSLKSKKSVLQCLIEYVGSESFPTTVVDRVIQYHLDHGIMVRQFQVTSYVQTILLINDPDYRYREQFQRLILNQVLPKNNF